MKGLPRVSITLKKFTTNSCTKNGENYDDNSKIDI